VRRLIITADDFGLSESVNEAVQIAHREGVLTAASLMVGAPAAADAVARAHRMPQLAVGLHVVVVQGRPVLPPGQIPDLVDATGRFADALGKAGVRYFFHPRARAQLGAEIRAQFEAFRASGLTLDHVNAHNHMHLHPTILGLILEVGRDYGMKAVRVPFEPALRSWRAARVHLTARIATNAFLWPWVAYMRARIRAAGLMSNDIVFGMHDSGAVSERGVLGFVERLPGGVTEMYFHPATGGEAPAQEFRLLTGEPLRAAIARAGIARGGYLNTVR